MFFLVGCLVAAHASVAQGASVTVSLTAPFPTAPVLLEGSESLAGVLGRPAYFAFLDTVAAAHWARHADALGEVFPTESNQQLTEKSGKGKSAAVPAYDLDPAMRLDTDPESTVPPMTDDDQARLVLGFASAWARCERGPGMINRVVRSVFPASGVNGGRELGDVIKPESCQPRPHLAGRIVSMSLSLRSPAARVAASNALALDSLPHVTEPPMVYIGGTVCASNDDVVTVLRESHLSSGVREDRGTLESATDQYYTTITGLLDGATAEDDLWHEHPVREGSLSRDGEAWERPPPMVLYTDLVSAGFTRMHARLRMLATEGRGNYLVFPFTRAAMAESDPSRVAELQPPRLQGYGAALHLKSTEYVVVDDRPGDGDGKKTTGDGDAGEDGDERNADEALPTNAAGVDLARIAARRGDIPRVTLRTIGDDIDRVAGSNPPPTLAKWQIKNLGLLALQRIVSSPGDQLAAARDISWNLPSLAGSLARQRPDAKIAAGLRSLHMRQRAGTDAIIINGMALDPTEATAAQVASVLASSEALASDLERAGVPSATEAMCVSSAAQSSSSPPSASSPQSFAVDMRHEGFKTLSDLERDKEYRTWPKSVKELASGGGPAAQGMPQHAVRQIARNVVTVAVVTDPAGRMGLDPFIAMFGLARQMAPVRVQVAMLTTSSAQPRESRSFARLFLHLHKKCTHVESHLFAYVLQSLRVQKLRKERAEDERQRKGSGVDPPEADDGQSDPPLDGELLEEAYSLAVKQSPCAKKRAAAYARVVETDVYDRVLSGMEKAVADLGVAGDLPLAAVNGAVIPDPTDRSVAAAVMAAFSGVANLVKSGAIDDDTKDPYAVVMSQPGVLSRYDRRVIAGDAEYVAFRTVEPVALASGARNAPDAESAGALVAKRAVFIHAGPVDDPAKDKSKGKKGKKGKKGSRVNNDDEAENPFGNAAVSGVLVADLSSPRGVRVALESLAAMRDPALRRFARLTLLHNSPPVSEDDVDETKRQAAAPVPLAWEFSPDVVRAGLRARGSPSDRLDFIMRYLARLLVKCTRVRGAEGTGSSKNGKGTDDNDGDEIEAALKLDVSLIEADSCGMYVTGPVIDIARGSSLGAEPLRVALEDLPPIDDAAEAGPERPHVSRSLETVFQRGTLRLVAGEAAIIVNGRVVRSVESVDIATLFQHEYYSRARFYVREALVPKALRSSGKGQAKKSGKPDGEEALDDSLPMIALSILGSRHKRVAVLNEADLPKGVPMTRTEGVSGVTVDAVIDPLSRNAQRLIPLAMYLRDRLGASIRVLWNPHAEVPGETLPLDSYYRYMLEDVYDYIGVETPGDEAKEAAIASARRSPRVVVGPVPAGSTYTLSLDTPTAWVVEQAHAPADMDNWVPGTGKEGDNAPAVAAAEYRITSVLVQGHATIVTRDLTRDPRGLGPVTRTPAAAVGVELALQRNRTPVSDSLVMLNLGYFQLQASQMGRHRLVLAGRSTRTHFLCDSGGTRVYRVSVMVKDLVGKSLSLSIERNPRPIGDASRGNNATAIGGDGATPLFTRVDPSGQVSASDAKGNAIDDGKGNGEGSDGSASAGTGIVDSILGMFGSGGDSSGDEQAPGGDAGAVGLPRGKGVSGLPAVRANDASTVHVFSVASGHLYERFMLVSMLSARKMTTGPLKYWVVSNFVSPKFRSDVARLAERYGFSYEFVSYQWPRWLRQQTTKQRIIWGNKILFLDVLFPLSVEKVIFVDADAIVRTDLRRLWNYDLDGAAYGFTPFCRGADANPDTVGFRFWDQGFWKDHLRGEPYHISALFVVDLNSYRRLGVGDTLRANYQSLTADPHSLANLDQDLPNYLQPLGVRIAHLPEATLWCAAWCTEESKGDAAVIDLCNNPRTKEPKLNAARRIVGEWEGLDEEVRAATAVRGEV